MYTGLTGRVSFFDNVTEKTVGYISNWSIEDTADIIEFAQLGGDGYKIKKAGLQSWSASADGAVSFESGNNHDKLFELKSGRKEIKVRFYLSKDQTTTEDQIYFEGYGFIESLSIDLSAEDKGNISISISGSSHTDNNKEYGLRLYKNGAPLSPL